MMGVAFTVFFVWLVVRLMNRRERWAKRLAVALVAMPLGYLVSFGPVAPIESRGGWSQSEETVFEAVYFPFGWAVDFGPQCVRSPIIWYLDLWGTK